MSQTLPAQLPHMSPYTGDTLSHEAQTDLSILVHFLLVFSQSLGLSASDLLHARVETSLLSQTGRPFDALVSFLASASKISTKTFLARFWSQPSSSEKLEYLRDVTDTCAHHADLRRFITAEDGRVLPAARLKVGARDSAGVAYTWVHGPDGCCSDRVVAASDASDCRVLRTSEILPVVTKLEGGGRRRHDMLAAGWLRERVDRSATRSGRVQRAEEERKKKKERALTISGLIGGCQVDVVGCGRGRRERKKVCYEEGDADDDAMDKDLDDEEEGFVGGDEEFVVDSGGEEDIDSTQDEEEQVDEADLSDCEDGWNTHPSAAGRRRVVSSNICTRSRAADEDNGRTLRKSVRALRNPYA